MYILHIDKNKFGVCYKEGVHDYIPTPCVRITDELFKYFVDISSFKLIDDAELEPRVYTIADSNLFEKIITTPTDPPISQPTITDRLAFLEAEHILNVSSILDLDFRVTDIEFNIETPMTINFKNTKGEIKTMARTPYQMMKTLILAGEYDESDMKNKINRYHEMNKISITEKEELIGLIEANKIVE